MPAVGKGEDVQGQVRKRNLFPGRRDDPAVGQEEARLGGPGVTGSLLGLKAASEVKHAATITSNPDRLDIGRASQGSVEIRD